MSMYICEPRKNKTCRGGGSCQVLCFLTTNPEYSADGRELTEKEVEEFEAHQLALAGGRDLMDEEINEEDDMEKEKTISEIIEEVKTDICMNYCKYPGARDEEKMGIELPESEICKNCPLDRL